MKVKVNMKDAGKKLNKLRIDNNFALEDVVINTGINASVLDNIENEISNISVLNLVKLCRLYKVKVDDVLCCTIEN